MAITTKTRSDLKSYFVKNAIPTESNFADLVDAQLNQADDGVFKIGDDPLSVVAASGDRKRVLRLYETYPAANPSWTLSLKPRSDPNDADTGQSGFGIDAPDGSNRLFLDQDGKLGLGTTSPADKLTVEGGDVRITGGYYRQLKIISDDYWAGIEIVARSVSTGGYPHIDFTHGDLNSPNFGLRLYARTNEQMVLLADSDAANTRLGIGVTPQEALHVNGNVKANGSITGATLQITSSASIKDLSTTGTLSAAGVVQAEHGFDVSTGDRGGHINRDGVLYRKDENVWLTVDNHFYIRDANDGNSWALHVDADNKRVDIPVLKISSNLDSHVDGDGILYRKGGQLWLTVDDNFYIRDSGNDSSVAHFNTNNGNLTISGKLYANKVYSDNVEVLPLRIKSGVISAGAANLQSGSGSRTQTVAVSYSGFSSAPTVVCALKLIDADKDQNLRIDTWVQDVTTTGCNIVVRAWSDTQIYNSKVSWIAYGT